MLFRPTGTTISSIRRKMCSMVGSTTPRVRGVGFPDFWQKAHDKFPQFFDVASVELISIGNEAFEGLLSRPIDKVARHLSRAVWNSLGSVMVLTLNGCGVDAMKIARGMFEASLTLGYLALHPELVDDYLDYNFIIQKQRNDFLKEHAPEHLKRVPGTIQEKIESEFSRVAPRFQDKRGKIRNSWSKTGVRTMAQELGKEALYLTFYDLLHQCITATSAVCSRRLKLSKMRTF